MTSENPRQIDFEFSGKRQGIIKSIKELYQDEERGILHQLSAFCKMSQISVTSLNDSRVCDFIQSDIGARDDEMWVVNMQRTVRRHPDRLSPYNIAFWKDSKILIVILLSQYATFDYLGQWVENRRMKVVDRLFGYHGINRIGQDDFIAEFRLVMKVSQLLTQPLAIPHTAGHAFFIRLAEELSRLLHLEAERIRASNTLADFTRVLESIAAYSNTKLSVSLSKLQLEIAKSAKIIGYIGVVLAVIAAILAALQVFAAFR